MATSNPQVQINRLASVHYLHPDLVKAHQFLLDFGMTVVERSETKIYYRGYGIDPYVYVAEQHLRKSDGTQVNTYSAGVKLATGKSQF